MICTSRLRKPRERRYLDIHLVSDDTTSMIYLTMHTNVHIVGQTRRLLGSGSLRSATRPPLSETADDRVPILVQYGQCDVNRSDKCATSSLPMKIERRGRTSHRSLCLLSIYLIRAHGWILPPQSDKVNTAVIANRGYGSNHVHT